MKLFEAVGRTNEMILSHVGDGNYNPTEHLPAMEASKDALLSVSIMLDAIGREWGVDLIKALEEARAKEE